MPLRIVTVEALTLLCHLPQLGQKQAGADEGGGGEDNKQEVDVVVHHRQQNTGGRTSAGLGQRKMSPPGIEPRFKV